MPVRAKRITPKSVLKRTNPTIINENIPPVIQTFFEKGNSDVSGGIWFSGIMNSYRLMYKRFYTNDVPRFCVRKKCYCALQRIKKMPICLFTVIFFVGRICK